MPLFLIWELNTSSPTSLAVDTGMSATERASEGNYLLLIKKSQIPCKVAVPFRKGFQKA